MHSTYGPPPPASLFDADRASSAARASITVGAVMRQDQIECAYQERLEAERLAERRLGIVDQFEAAHRADNWPGEVAALQAAVDFDREHPSGQPLAGELRSMMLGMAA
ncbi:hypothetical protein JBE04_17980 [Streptomyces sp. PRKS01-29]|nr:hypothetical protein [Streptomyces sabulosicollis]MBI0296301.1 hypothetical protein [Streptomyces sabulosicollis]